MTTRRQFLFYAVGLTGAVRLAGYDTTKAAKLEDALTSELCSLKPPNILYQALAQNSFYFDLGIASEAGEDRFYQVYARKLRPVVDERYPQVQKYRQSLIDAFLATNRFLDMAFRDGTGFGHRENRLPAEIEWAILEGESKMFESAWTDKFEHEDILTFGRIVARAKFEIQGPEDLHVVDRKQMPELRTAVRHLKAAEKHLSERARRYFRRRVLRFIAETL